MTARFWLASFTLWQREMVRFVRQRSRVIGALGPPIIFWFLIGSGLGDSFHLATLSGLENGSANYLQYFFPGTIALIVLFTAIFSTISIIEDRHEGFLQSVLVAPGSRQRIVLGKILGGTTLAFGQALLFLCLAPTVGLRVHWMDLGFLLLVLFLMAFSLTGLGFLLAWRLDSTQGFHAIMNLFLIPMWLLSGALFPLATAPAWLRAIMYANPLTYGVTALQSSLTVNGHILATPLLDPMGCLLVSLGFAGLMYALSAVSAARS